MKRRRILNRGLCERGMMFLLLPLLLSCGASQENHPSNISFDLPTALTKAAAAGDLEARFVGVTGIRIAGR